MLARNYRIKRKKEFETIFKKGISLKTNLFILKCLRNHLEYSRFGFVVSQKVSKKAVVRNKIRRRLSEVMNGYVDKLAEHVDIVFIVLAGAGKKDFSEVKEVVEGVLVKQRLISKK